MAVTSSSIGKRAVSASSRSRRRGAAGLTFIEILIATAVLAVAGLVAFPTMLSFVALSSAAREKNVATHDLVTAAEDVRSAPFNQVTLTYRAGQPIPKFTALHLSNESISVSYADPAADPLLITLQATWRDSTGHAQQEVIRCARTR